MRYSLDDFENYIKNNNIENLNEETLAIIEKIASEVGAPEYSKTPQFNKLRKKKFNEFNDNEWNTIRQFQATEFIKREGLDINLFNVRKCLNVLTDKNYDTILEKISNEFNEVISTKTPNDVLVLCNLFYEICSQNILYSSLCAKLYTDLINISENLLNIVTKNIELSKKQIDEITYIDPDENYDKFCENNKLNEKIRSQFTFFTNLMKNDVISYTFIYNIIEYLFTKLHYLIKEGNKKNELDEISELIYILVSNSFNKIRDNDNKKYDYIFKSVEEISRFKVKTTPGVSNKCIFKHMDLLDEL